jgi:hypothetical protein
MDFPTGIDDRRVPWYINIRSAARMKRMLVPATAVLFAALILVVALRTKEFFKWGPHAS